MEKLKNIVGHPRFELGTYSLSGSYSNLTELMPIKTENIRFASF